jgi:hypothetical protein
MFYVPPGIRLQAQITDTGVFMGKRSKKEKSSQEQIKKRMENSLPWSLSRWFAKLLGRKK